MVKISLGSFKKFNKKNLIILQPSDKIAMGGAFLPLLFVISVTHATPAGAQSPDPCATPVDMRAPGGSMEHVPVLSQDGMGICYAYAATQMYDAYRLSRPTNKQSATARSKQASPLAAVIESAENHWFSKRFKQPLGTTADSTCASLNFVLEHGACDHAAIRNGANEDDFAFEIRDRIKEYSDFWNRYNPDNRAPVGHGACHTFEKPWVLPSNFPLTPDVMRQFKQSDNAHDFIHNTLLAACKDPKNRIQAPIPRCKDTSIHLSKTALKTLHQQLSRPNPQPIGISYCSAILRSGRNFKPPLNLVFANALGKDCGGHGSVIIGRRMGHDKNGAPVCQFLLRNSWGTDCRLYSKDWDCEKGNLWIDAALLSKGVYRISTIGED